MKREYKIQIVDTESDTVIYEHYFDYVDGKLKYLPSGNDMKATIKKHAEMESEFDPK